jgi:WD40 repeat protein
MRLWDLESGKELRRFNGGTVVGVAFSPDGRRALHGDGTHCSVRVWDVETGAELKQLVGHAGAVTGVIFLAEGRQALSCSHDHTLRLWDLDSGQEIRRFSGHRGAVQNVAITRDGRQAISASSDKTVRVWDLRTGKELHCFTGHTKGVIGIAVSPDSKFALSGGEDGTMRLWRLPDPPAPEKVGEVQRIRWHNWLYSGLDLSPDGRLLVAAQGNDQTRVYDVATGRVNHELEGWKPRFTPDGKRIVTAATASGTREGGILIVYDTESGKELLRFGESAVRYGSLQIAPDGRTALTIDSQGANGLWDLERGQRLVRWSGPSGHSFRGLYHRDGRRLILYENGPAGRMLNDIWDIRDHKSMKPCAPFTSVLVDHFLPGGREVVGRSRGESLPIHDAVTGKLVRRVLPRGPHALNTLSDWRGSGNRMMVSLEDGSVCVLDLVTGEQLAHCSYSALLGERKGVLEPLAQFRPTCLAVSVDGRFACAAAMNQKSDLVVWRLPEPAAASGATGKTSRR